MKKLLLAVAALVALASSALATPKMECSVNDPTGTPLNVRNGTIVGALANGTPVFASEMSKDGRWVKILQFRQLRLAAATAIKKTKHG